MELRPYQRDLVDNIRTAINRGNQRVCAVLGCGGGKSVIIATIARASTDNGARVLFLVHRRELVEQIKRTMHRQGVDPDLCSVMMVQTASRRLRNLAPPVLIIVDEAHHILSRTYQKIIEYFPKALVVGFTATPQRMGEGGLGKVFQQLITSVSTKWLIDNHYLAPYHLYSAPLADPKGLHTRNGDYAPEEVAELMEKGAIFGDTVKNWKHYADGKKTIVYCASIKSSKGTAAAFQAAGIPAEHLDGQTPAALRQKIVEDFRAGRVLVLCNVDLFGEGFDVPDCEAVCLLRPTKSLTLYIQQAMRPMRTDPDNPGKEAIILDHVGNYTRHGFPDDDREWSLKPKKRKKQAETTVTQCPVCFHVFKPAPTCPYCGYEFKAAKDSSGGDKDREQETVDGLTLEEIKESPYGDYKRCKTFAELEIFRKAKGYKFGWSLHKAAEMGLELPPKYRGVARKFNEGWFRRRKA